MNVQKVALVVVAIVVVGYVGYRVQRAGGFNEFVQELRVMGRTTPSPSPTPTIPPPTNTPAASVALPPLSESAAMLNVMNTRRGDAGSDPLAVNAILQREAQEHADDMARRGYFSHESPEGVTFQQRMSSSGYPSAMLAENIGLTSGQAAEVVSLWMDSEGHRTTVLDPRFTAVGVGVARGAYQGQQAAFVVAIFGDTR